MSLVSNVFAQWGTLSMDASTSGQFNGIAAILAPVNGVIVAGYHVRVGVTAREKLAYAMQFLSFFSASVATLATTPELNAAQAGAVLVFVDHMKKVVAQRAGYKLSRVFMKFWPYNV